MKKKHKEMEAEGRGSSDRDNEEEGRGPSDRVRVSISQDDIKNALRNLKQTPSWQMTCKIEDFDSDTDEYDTVISKSELSIGSQCINGIFHYWKDILRNSEEVQLRGKGGCSVCLEKQ